MSRREQSRCYRTAVPRERRSRLKRRGLFCREKCQHWPTQKRTARGPREPCVGRWPPGGPGLRGDRAGRPRCRRRGARPAGALRARPRCRATRRHGDAGRPSWGGTRPHLRCPQVSRHVAALSGAGMRCGEAAAAGGGLFLLPRGVLLLLGNGGAPGAGPFHLGGRRGGGVGPARRCWRWGPAGSPVRERGCARRGGGGRSAGRGWARRLREGPVWLRGPRAERVSGRECGKGQESWWGAARGTKALQLGTAGSVPSLCPPSAFLGSRLVAKGVCCQDPKVLYRWLRNRCASPETRAGTGEPEQKSVPAPSEPALRRSQLWQFEPNFRQSVTIINP